MPWEKKTWQDPVSVIQNGGVPETTKTLMTASACRMCHAPHALEKARSVEPEEWTPALKQTFSCKTPGPLDQVFYSAL
jgi:hypothetical protein